MKKYILILIAVVIFMTPSFSLYAQSDSDNSKLKELSLQVSKLQEQQEQILENQKQILTGIEEIKKTVNQIRGM